MIRRVREHGLDCVIVAALIKASAPIEIRQDLLAWWEGEFFPEAQERLTDESDTKYSEASEFLKDNCNIKNKIAGKRKT